MKLISEQPAVDSIPVRDMKDGDFAVVVSVPAHSYDTAFNSIHGVQLGEVIYLNTAGWHGLSAGRWWPSEFALNDGRTGQKRYAYVPDFRVRLLAAGDVLKVKA